LKTPDLLRREKLKVVRQGDIALLMVMAKK
jgi:hypothetical protein